MEIFPTYPTRGKIMIKLLPNIIFNGPFPKNPNLRVQTYGESMVLGVKMEYGPEFWINLQRNKIFGKDAKGVLSWARI